MNKFKSWLKAFIFGEEEEKGKPRKKGKIHIVTPDGRVELIADFNNKADFNRIKRFVDNEDEILFAGKNDEYK